MPRFQAAYAGNTQGSLKIQKGTRHEQHPLRLLPLPHRRQTRKIMVPRRRRTRPALPPLRRRVHRIGPKNKGKAWVALFARTLAEQRRRNGYDPAALAARKHQLEREAAALSAQLNDAKNPPHPSHAKQIRHELRRVQNALVWYGVQPDEAA